MTKDCLIYLKNKMSASLNLTNLLFDLNSIYPNILPSDKDMSNQPFIIYNLDNHGLRNKVIELPQVLIKIYSQSMGDALDIRDEINSLFHYESDQGYVTDIESENFLIEENLNRIDILLNIKFKN